MKAAQCDQTFRDVFCNENFASLVFDTGYRKALSIIHLDDREELIKTLRQYHTMIRGQIELDQFVIGLKCYGLLDMIREYPLLMKPLFVSNYCNELSKSECT